MNNTQEAILSPLWSHRLPIIKKQPCHCLCHQNCPFLLSMVAQPRHTPTNNQSKLQFSTNKLMQNNYSSSPTPKETATFDDTHGRQPPSFTSSPLGEHFDGSTSLKQLQIIDISSDTLRGGCTYINWRVSCYFSIQCPTPSYDPGCAINWTILSLNWSNIAIKIDPEMDRPIKLLSAGTHATTTPPLDLESSKTPVVYRVAINVSYEYWK